MTHELYKKHRPTLFKHVVGNEKAKTLLRGWVKSERTPQTILFHGPSGTGKTTLARILAKAIGSEGRDLQELNCSSKRGIDLARDIQKQCSLSPMGSKCRVWIVDEAQGLTSDAQDALLKTLEDTPPTSYFFLCSTNQEKIKRTIITRCSQVPVKCLTPGEMTTLITRVAEAEEEALSEELVEAIIEAAEGSPRAALVTLESVFQFSGDDERVASVISPTIKVESIELARALMNTSKKWKDVAALLKSMDRSEPEKIRWLVLSYADTLLLSGNPKLDAVAALVIQSFRDNFFDSKKAGLDLACWEVVAHR